jgi:hypothetical protein
VAQPGLKRGTFSPDWLVPVATTGTKGLYQPGLKVVFLLVVSLYHWKGVIVRLLSLLAKTQRLPDQCMAI